ncbi:MAG: hypothetical protein RR303_11980 [Bacteroidales bacterium]
MNLNKKEIAILKKYGSKNEEIELINEISRKNGWTHHILSQWVSYVVQNTPFMYDGLETWANHIAHELENSENKHLK